jgi:antitoxin HigA-1
MNRRKSNPDAARKRGLKPRAETRQPAAELLPPIPPGEVLAEEFLKPLGVSQNALARAIRVPPARVNDIIHGRRAMTADTAVRLSLFFGTSIEFWINLQAQFEARVARDNLQPRLRGRIRPFAAA